MLPGSNGGTVTVITPGALKVTTANLVVNGTDGSAAGKGANVTLSGTKSVLIVGDLDTHTGAGAYGDIHITSGSALAFNIDGTIGTTVNGQTSTNGQDPCDHGR